jgi:alkylation response protein AidB-like acyl-CoA dehydrogenase
MDFRFTPAQESFRQELRDFLTEELPKLRDAGDAESFGAHSQPFSKKLSAKGWIGMAWPKEFGGKELSPIERTIFTEEMVASEAPTSYHHVAERQMGPSLIRQGTEEQKQYFLPRIVSADVSFAIGMSEPGAGSGAIGSGWCAARTRMRPSIAASRSCWWI